MSKDQQPDRNVGRDVIDLWRVLVAVFVCQLVGRFVGRAVIDHPDTFMRGWVGGAIGTPVGHLIGTAWYFLKVRRLTVLPGILLLGLTLMALYFGGSGVMEYRNLMRARDVTAAITSLPDDAFDRIEVWDEYRQGRLFSIENPETLDAFARALSDGEYYDPRGPRYVETWHLRTFGRRQYTMYCHFQDEQPDAVVVTITISDSLLFPSNTTLISRNLRPWFDEYVVEADGE